MRELGYGRDYVYDPSSADGIDYSQTSFPEALGEKIYYQPGANGAEIKIREKLEQIRALRAQARAKER